MSHPATRRLLIRRGWLLEWRRLLSVMCMSWQGFYGVYEELFDKLAKQEAVAHERRGDRKGKRPPGPFPRFGTLSSWLHRVPGRGAPAVKCSWERMCNNRAELTAVISGSLVKLSKQKLWRCTAKCTAPLCIMFLPDWTTLLFAITYSLLNVLCFQPLFRKS